VTPTKILWGQIVVVLLVAAAGIWGATEWTAWRLGFQQQLGLAWFTLADLPVYPPPSFFWWWYHYDAYAPAVFIEGAAIASSGGFIAVAVAIAGSMWRARWATPTEIREAGLCADAGVVLGRLQRGYLRHDGPEHVLCFAPTRSGKGVGLVIPSLLTWPGSAIVHDIKGENCPYQAEVQPTRHRRRPPGGVKRARRRRSVGSVDGHSGSIPCALSTGHAIGPARNLISSRATLGAAESALTAALHLT
jgi:type IV secretion system protein VirD4